MFDHVCKRNCLSDRFDLNPNPLSLLGLGDDYNESTLYTSKTIPLIT